MLEKQIVIGKIEVVETGHVQVRQDTVILDDGVEVSRTYHRLVLDPGSDVSTMPDRIAKVCGVVWTPEVIQAHQDRQAVEAARTTPEGTIQ